MQYKGTAKIYDLLNIIYFRNENRNPRILVSKFIQPEDARILDICTGTAANAIAIAKCNKEAEIVGIDISTQMLHIAENKVKLAGLSNVKLCNMDATKTTLKDNTFDVVVISLVLHEISDELAGKILSEAKRVLKPEGKLLVIEWERPQTLRKKMLFYPIRKMEPKGFEQFLGADMRRYFERFGFELLAVEHCDYTKILCLRKSLPSI